MLKKMFAGRMRRGLLGLVLLVWAFGHCCPAASHAESPQIKPLFDKARLRVNGRNVNPVRIYSPSEAMRVEHFAGSRRFIVDDDRVAEVNPKTGEELWNMASRDGAYLRWLAARDGVAYFAGTSASVERLHLRRRKWLKPLKSTDAMPAHRIRAFLVDDRGALVFVSTTSTLEPADRDAGEQRTRAHYMLTYFQDGQDKQAWSRHISLDGDGERPYTGGLLLSATRPDYAFGDVQTLSWLGNNVLVCPGELPGLLCFDRAKGQLLWRLTRLWEFERTFKGPSVWNHSLKRRGRDQDHEFEDDPGDVIQVRGASPSRDDEREARYAPARPPWRLSNEIEGAIVGGPVVVTKSRNGRGSTSAIFVAVAKGPKDAWSGYLADCVIYELDAQGGPIAMHNSHRMVIGQSFRLLSDGLAWSTQRGGLMRISLTELPGFPGPGMVDCLCKVEWYREFRPTFRRAWFSADPVDGVATFSRRSQFRTVSGGYVRKAEEAVYRFPIAVVDLSKGSLRELKVAVPLERQLKLPQVNARAGAGGVHAEGPHLLAITGLEVDNAGRRLKVVLGMDDSATGLEFALPNDAAE